MEGSTAFNPNSDANSRIRDIEDKQRLLKDRVLLVGQSLVDERDKTFEEMQDMKKTLIKLEEENKKMKLFIQRIAEQVDSMARKEELIILQRQFDLFRE